MSPKHIASRNDLFLVRFWLQDMSSEFETERSWAGRVQRAVSGEVHEFNDWDELVKALREMLSSPSPSFTVERLPESKVNSESELGEKGEQE